MGYKETYKEDWNLKKYGILQSRTLCKKICGERPTVMVKQYRQQQSCKQEEGSLRVKKAMGLNRELIHFTGEKQPECWI